MQLPGSMTVAAAEALLRELADGPVDPRLLVPTRGRHQAAGGEAACLQALLTWANNVQPVTLRSYAESGDDVQVERLTARLYGLAGALCADRAETRTGEDLTDPLLDAARARLSDLQSADPRPASRGPQLEILSVDHLGRGAPRSVYDCDADGVATLKRLPAFNRLATLMLRTVVPTQMAELVAPAVPAALGNALHELFRNTEEHARVNDRGDLPRKSVRGFQAKRHEIEPGALGDLAAGSAPLAAYCARLRPARTGNRHVQLVELSVFDCGPGLGPSLSGLPLDDLPPERERRLVASCFEKHVSRKSLSSAGLGLPNVVHALRVQNGFLRLRTGRQALFADLGLEADAGFGEPPRLRDWFDGAEPRRATGTLFTLLFPLGGRR